MADDPDPDLMVDPERLSSTLRRNITVLRESRLKERREAPVRDRIADAITRFSGSLSFVWLHLALFGAWAAANLGLVPGVPRFDPTFVGLATIASVEAIFLATFVLISQNRSAAQAERRAELDLQISLLAEHEVTRLIKLTDAIAARLGVAEVDQAELAELERDVAPEAVLDELSDDKRG